MTPFDLTDRNTYDQALKGVDRVFLMRPPHLGKPEDLQPFIDAMKAHDVKLVRPGFFKQNVSGIHSVEIKERNEIFVARRQE